MQIDTRNANESIAKCLPDFAMQEGDCERFWNKVVRREPERCWQWIGARAHNGYGMFKIGGKVRTAHRLSLFLHTGHFGEVAQHSCDNRACVNPGHLSWSTQRDNVADAVAKGRHGQRGPKPDGAVKRKPRPLPPVEAGAFAMMQRDNARMRKAGTSLAEAALRVVRDYDGLHRLSLAVAAWARAVACEGDRPHERTPTPESEIARLGGVA